MSAAEEEVVYGLLRLGGMDVALPLAALREVVPCPMRLAGLPASAPGLLGALELRALLLPVVDLRPVLELPALRGPEQVVVVVAHEGQVLGLLADEVRGITRLRNSARVPVRGDGGLLFSHTFRHPEGGHAVSVLDAGALLARPGVPTVADATRDASGADAVARAGDARDVRTLTLVRCGPYRFGIEVGSVHTTLPRPEPRPSVLSGPLCLGVVDFADREVPVVDPLVLCGLGQIAADDVDAGLVLELEHGYVVLALSSLLDLAEVAVEDVLPVPAFAVARPELVSGIVQVGDGDTRSEQALVLDGGALMTEPSLMSLATVNTALDAATTETRGAAVATAAAAGAPTYLTYSIGVDLATPVDQVSEIVPFPGTVTATAVDGLLGVVVHRRAAVPVLCLATLLGRPTQPVTAASCLLLVAVDDELVAFAVDALRSIDPLTWCDPEQALRDDDPLSLRSARLVAVGGDARLLPEVDLRRVARAVRGRSRSGAAPAPADRAPALTAG